LHKFVQINKRIYYLHEFHQVVQKEKLIFARFKNCFGQMKSVWIEHWPKTLFIIQNMNIGALRTSYHCLPRPPTIGGRLFGLAELLAFLLYLEPRALGASTPSTLLCQLFRGQLLH